jgi:tetratricopeptide (TPR) repeat protein
MRALFRLLALILALATPAAAETRLTIPQARALAVSLQQQGQPAAARSVALMLVKRDPADVTALVVLSRAARDMGDLGLAAKAGRTAFRLAEDPEPRFAAAMATAQALASEGRWTAAQSWLRTAADAAPNDAAARAAARDFAYVRRRNPWRLAFDGGLAPSSNVNGGPTRNTVVIGGFEFADPEAVPLSGLVGRFAAEAAHTRDLGPGRSLTLAIAAETEQVALSSASRAAVPSARGSDYASATLDLSAAWTLARPDGRKTTLAATIGRDWYGGDPLADRLRLSWTGSRALSPQTGLSLGLALTGTRRLDEDLRSSTAAEATLGWSRKRENGDRLGLSLTLTDTASDAASTAHQAARGTLTYALGHPVGGPLGNLALSGYLRLGLRQDNRPLYTTDPRSDRSVELGLSAVLIDHSWRGFAPEIGLTANRTWSDVSLYDTERIDLTIGIRSLF